MGKNANAENANVEVEYVNNHIHTTYSFSPYTPAQAVRMAGEAGLTTAGIMDHDTVAGAEEFIRAGAEAGIATTVGLECRCTMAGTPFEGRRLNNPDQLSVAYLALHGIPHGNLGAVQDFITPYRRARDVRSRRIAEKLDALFAPHGISLSFDRDVYPLSESARGGTITERHILFALAGKLAARYGKGAALLGFLESAFGVAASGGVREKLLSPDTAYYEYYLLGLLKSSFSAQFYIDADAELPAVGAFLDIAARTGAIPTYAYLGDVAGSVTGDKKDQAFEDVYLDELVAWLAAVGFRALTYMPARNTPAQLDRVSALCERHGLFQISGEDVNTPFQSFICPALADPRFARLVTATWALIGHETAATRDPGAGMFTERTLAKTPSLAARVERFAAYGRANWRTE